MNGQQLPVKPNLDVLGFSFRHDMNHTEYVDKKIVQCKRKMFAKCKYGFSYPGLAAKCKAYLWNTYGVPALTYGVHCIKLSSTQLSALETTQGNMVKYSLGISKWSRSTNVLNALAIPKIKYVVEKKYRRIMAQSSEF